MDNSDAGGTGEDRFIGIRSTARIVEVLGASVFQSQSFIDYFEMDDIQFGVDVVPEPYRLPSFLAAICGFLCLRNVRKGNLLG